MATEIQHAIAQAVIHLRQGHIVAYPTEAVYGFGVDPFNADAVTHLLQLKERSYKKGFILIADEFSRFAEFIEPLPPKLLANILQTWPGPVTWLFPTTPKTPEWIHGGSKKIAIRVTDHPIARRLCQQFGKPLISTSANISSFPALRDTRTVIMHFADKVDFIVPGECGTLKRPTEIRDATSGEIIRPG